jgi:hypothetical protein
MIPTAHGDYSLRGEGSSGKRGLSQVRVMGVTGMRAENLPPGHRDTGGGRPGADDEMVHHPHRVKTF